MKKHSGFALIISGLLLASSACAAPLATRQVINLWPGTGIGPGSEQSPAQLTITERSKVAYWPDRIITGITRPNLTAFVPDHPNGTAVIVAPGGAYSRIVLDKEAAEMARWLNPHDVTVFLMQYRLPAEGHKDGKDVPIEDAQRAVRVVRAHAKEWGLNPNKIGFLGASAAGHMAAMLGDEFNKSLYKPVDAADKLSARPDFMILLYPVITMQANLTNTSSRNNLLGKQPPAALVNAYSAEKHVTKDNPPTFITLAQNDPAVPANANGIAYAKALQKAGVAVDLHVFKLGGHGFGIRDTRQLPVSHWPQLATIWLQIQGYIK